MTLSENVQKVIELSQRIVVEKSVIQSYEEVRRNTMTTAYNVEKRTTTTSSTGGSIPIHSSQVTTETAHRVTERKFHTSSSASEILSRTPAMTPMEDAEESEECLTEATTTPNEERPSGASLISGMCDESHRVSSTSSSSK